MLAVGCAATVAVAVLLWWPPPGWVARLRLGDAGVLRARHVGVPALGLAVVAGLGPVLARPAWSVLAVTVLGAGVFAHRQVRQARARTSRHAARDECAEAIDLLAAELRAGVLPARALASLARDVPVLTVTAHAAAHGGDVAEALGLVGREPGREAYGALAGAWRVVERSGAPMADVLERLAQSVRDDTEVLREIAVGVAPARATALMMAVMPLVGLALGAGLGGDPVGFVTGTVAGALCVAAGVALACAGVAWIERIACRAEEV